MKTACLVATVLVAVCVVDATGGLIVVVGNTGDGNASVNGLPGSLGAPATWVGTGGNDVRGFAAIYFFALPTLSPGSTLTGAQLRVEYLGLGYRPVPDFSVGLFGINARADATILASDYYDGNAALSSDTLLQTAVVTPTTPVGTSIAVANPGLLDFVQTLYQADGTPVSTFAAFRFSADIDLPVYSGWYRGYELASADNANASYRPQLSLTTTDAQVPEPSSLVLFSGLGIMGLAMGRRRKRQRK